MKSLDINQMLAYARREQGEADSKVTRPYSQVELVFVCIEKMINSVGSLPLVISTIDDEIVESGPVMDLLFNNKDYSWQKFIRDWIGHWQLSRDVFIAYLDKDINGLSAFQVINGSQMRPLTTNGSYSGQLLGWQFCGLYGERQRFDLANAYQTKNFNPHDKFHGQSPLGPAKNSIDYSFAAALYNASSLNNGAEPGPIFSLEGNPDEAKIRAFLDNFETRHGGPNKTNRPCALSGVKDIKTIAKSMADMQVAEISNMSDKKICVTFDTPPELVGLGTEAQYSQGPAQRAYMFYSVMPVAKLFADEITSSLLNQFYPSTIRSTEFSKSKMFKGTKFKPVQRLGYLEAKQKAIKNKKQLFAWFDFQQHPAIQEAMRESTKEILNFADRIPINNLIQVHDLPYEELPWGNEVFISPALVPARWVFDAGPGSLIEPPLPEGDEPQPEKSIDLESDKSAQSAIEKADESRKHRIWNTWTKSWQGIEKEYTAAMRTLFLRQQRELLEKLQAAMKENKAIEKVKEDDIIARIVFDIRKENGKIRAINQTFFEKASELGIRQAATEAGIVGDALNTFVDATKRNTAIRRALTIQAQKIQSINKTTQDMLSRQLRQGLNKNEGLNDLTKRIQEVLGSNRQRAQSIARTQTGSAVSTGRHVGNKVAGIDGKIWLDAHDDNVRKLHADAGKRYAIAIPIDEPFILGGEFLMHPGDPHGSAANIVNCRCLELAAKVGESKSAVFARYEKTKFYSFEDMQTKAA
jgi:HK97 family phage portal protein